MKLLASKYDLDDSLENNFEETRNDIINYAAKILLVGRFSAGKSALLNGILTRDILKENQLPETALATELKYSEDERCELIKNDGERVICQLDAVEAFDPDEFIHAVYYVNCAFLKNHQDIILVDMPGFDSSIERHNKAILQYVEQASAYILVVDCEDGALSQPTIDFLNEIKLYHSNLVVVITKCDKKTPDDVAVIESQIRETASNVFSEDIHAISVSAFDSQLDTKLTGLLDRIDTQAVFEEKFRASMNTIRSMLLVALKSTKRSLYYDSTEIDSQINQIEREKNVITQQMRVEQKKLHQSLFYEAFPSVINDVRNALLSNSTSLTNAAISGSDSFQHCVNNIIRPILVTSLNANIEESFTAFVDSAEFSMSDVPDGDEVTKHISDLFGKFQRVLNGYHFDTKGDTSRGKSKGGFQAIMAALAITTNVIAPWLEIILVFLPDIIQIFGKYQRKLQMDELNSKIRNQIIPEIIRRLEPEVKKSFEEIEEKLMAELIEKVNVVLEIKKDALCILKEKSSAERKEYEEKAADIETDIKCVSEIMNEGRVKNV